MLNCKTCIHNRACASWITHDMALYSDFTYSVESCRHYEPVIEAEWIDEWNGRYANPKYICSSCKITALSDEKIYFLTPWCPHCGARMKNGV